MAIQDISSGIVFLGCYVKRASATFGINESPTTIEIDMISPHSPTANDMLVGASGFKPSAVKPGTTTRLTIGGLDFVGVIQKWDETLSPDAGRVYNLRLVDPRLCFDNIVVALDGQTTTTRTENYLDAFGYYGDPVSAGATPNGMRWDRIRNFLENSSGINLYGYRYQLQFSSGFHPVASGVPKWYRVPQTQTTLGSVLGQVTQDMNMDYYAYIEPTGFNPTGLSTIKVQHIHRRVSSDISLVSGYLNGLQSSGTLVNYRYGEELRSDPTTVVLQGAPYSFWVGPATPTSDLDPSPDVRCFWGNTPDGTAITTDNGSASGIVLLDHIVGTGSENLPTITLPVVDIYKVDVGTYPPQTVIQGTTRVFKGFRPTINAMRAALFSQEAWESVFYYDDPVTASGCGIYDQRFPTFTEWSGNVVGAGTDLSNPTGGEDIYNRPLVSSFTRLAAEIYERDTLTDVLVSSVYQAVRDVAERFYGLSWMCKLQTSTWLQSSTFDASELYPVIEYEIVGSAWAENNAMPDGIPLHAGLMASGSTILKDEQGLLRPIFSTPINVRTGSYSPIKFPYLLDTKRLAPETYWLEASGGTTSKLVIPISCEQYTKYPASGIVTFPFPLEGIVGTSGTRYDNQRAFYGYLKIMGYPDDVIHNFKLIDLVDDNSQYGVVPPRLNYLRSSPSEGFGLYIPLRSRTTSYGPFIASGAIPGGCRLVMDGSVQPASYGSRGSMLTAGNDIVNTAGSTVTVIDSADVTVAGIPERNLGDIVGGTAVITSLALSYGVDGLSTSYGLRTFVFAPGRVTKKMVDKIVRGFNYPGNTSRTLVDLDKIENKMTGNIYKPDQIGKAINHRNPGNYDGRTEDRPLPPGIAAGGFGGDINVGLYF